MSLSAFRGRRVLVTGHTGFKGSWLAIWLHQLGATVHGYSLPPPTNPSNYALARVQELLAGETLGDIRDQRLLRDTVTAFAPEVVFHLAAQSLVRSSYAMPFETFEVNVMGTAAVLDALKAAGNPCAVVCVTTDKCYENREQVWGYRECDPMGGGDPYSASKGAAEILVASYRNSFFSPSKLAQHGVQLASARAGNVIGGGDWARDRIVPDMVAALVAGRPIPVRNPHAIRPWQHVLEPLCGYLRLAASMLQSPSPEWCGGWNFGPFPGTALSVGKLADAFVDVWGQGEWLDQSSPEQAAEASILRLCIDKAECKLDWHPRWNFAEMVEKTVGWYQDVLCQGGDARAACIDDIEAYGEGAPWQHSNG